MTLRGLRENLISPTERIEKEARYGDIILGDVAEQFKKLEEQAMAGGAPMDVISKYRTQYGMGTPEYKTALTGLLTAYQPTAQATQSAQTQQQSTIEDLINKRFAPRESELERTVAAAAGRTGGFDKGGYATSLAKGKALLEAEKAGETIDWDKFLKSYGLQEKQYKLQEAGYFTEADRFKQQMQAYQEYQDALKKQQPSGFESFLENLMTNQGFGAGMSKLIFGL